METSSKPAHPEVDVPLMFRLWNTPGITINEVASALGLSLGQLRSARDRYGLGDRPVSAFDLDGPGKGDPSPEEIAARAAEVRKSWPQWRIDGRSPIEALRYSYDGRQHVFRRASH